MSVPAAYATVVFIWATTPLAIKWSSEDAGPWLGVSLRMLLGVFACLVLVALMSRRMRWYAAARHTYLVAGLGIWVAMGATYWGAQYVSSGMISVVFGLTPVVTGFMSVLWLAEKTFTSAKVLGMSLGLLGLILISHHSLQMGDGQIFGVLAILVSVFAHSMSAVWIKRIDAGLHPLETTTGALMVAVTLFWISWGGTEAVSLADLLLITTLSERAWWSILYLGVIASSFGFALYYYVLREVTATGVALITLMTPVLALLLGSVANQESISMMQIYGTAIILLGLISFQWGGQLMRFKGG